MKKVIYGIVTFALIAGVYFGSVSNNTEEKASKTLIETAQTYSGPGGGGGIGGEHP